MAWRPASCTSTEDKLALASRVAGIDYLAYILAAHERFKDFKLLVLVAVDLKAPRLRHNGEV